MRRYEEQPPTTDTPDWKSISDKKPQQKLVRKCSRTAGCSFSIVCELIIRTKPILLYMTKWFKQWFLTSPFRHTLCYYMWFLQIELSKLIFSENDLKTQKHLHTEPKLYLFRLKHMYFDRKYYFCLSVPRVCDNELKNYLIFQWIFDLMFLMTFQWFLKWCFEQPLFYE